MAGRRVIALDPRGMGDSDRPASGYEMRTVAAELHGFLEALRLTANGPIDIVCHDLGTWMGHACAAEWPGDVKRLAVFDALMPGITPPPPVGIPSAEANVKTWQLAFNRLDDLPEILLQGREREFLTWLFRAKSTRPWTITPADLDEYVRINAAPGATRAALSYYRHNLTPEGRSLPRRRRADHQVHGRLSAPQARRAHGLPIALVPGVVARRDAPFAAARQSPGQTPRACGGGRENPFPWQ
jgi:pimeloyl-ACP methyl ester carboxylesterase